MDKKEYRKKYYQEYYKNPVKKRELAARGLERYADPEKRAMDSKTRETFYSNPENKKKKAEYDRKYHAERRKKDKMFKLRYQVYNSFNNLLKRGDKESMAYMFLDKFCYSLEDLITRLIETLPDGYKWGDYLDGILQIDHIKPVSKFKFKSVDCDDFKKCWALSNLQLLTKEDNLNKYNK